MIKNWKVTAWLCSPLAGEPPAFDAVLEYELALRLGMKHSRKLGRNIPLSDIERPPIPLSKRDIGDRWVYRCSDPILPPPRAEWTDHLNKRIDTHVVAMLLDDSQRKNLLTSSGPYKMRHAPIRVRAVDCVVWFVRGDRKEINKLVKRVLALGKYRHYGYGLVARWQYDEIDDDNSIVAMHNGQPVLMKTVPVGPHLSGVKGYRKSYGGAYPPYWHPDNAQEIAIPC